MDRPRPLIVLGSGPVGLLSAIRGRQLGLDVEIHASERPLSRRTAAGGVRAGASYRPARGVWRGSEAFGADTLFNERIVQWSDRTASKLSTPGVAHVGRPALDIALLETALRAGARLHAMHAVRPDEFKQRHRKRNVGCSTQAADQRSRRYDAFVPERPIVARLFHVPTWPSLRSSALMIAAGPEGYAYRLANAATLTIGVVGRKELVRGDGPQIVARDRGLRSLACRRYLGQNPCRRADRDPPVSNGAMATVQVCRLAMHALRVTLWRRRAWPSVSATR